MTTQDDDNAAATEAPAKGVLRRVLAVRDFRIALAGSFASNIGTWMQTVVIGAFVYSHTGSSAAVGLASFMQLGPMLFLPLVGGALAATMNMRTLLVGAQIEQLLASCVLAFLLFSDDPWMPGIYLCVLAVGIGNALNGPAWMSVLPDLVGIENIGGAVSLNSAQMNAARIVGPAIGGALYPWIGPGGVVATNAASYTFAIFSLSIIDLPQKAKAAGSSLRKLGAGFVSARRNPVLGRILIGMAVFSLMSLPFVYQLPSVASANLGIDVDGRAYGLLFAGFGVGAVTGAISVSAFTIFAHRSRTVMFGLISFGTLLLILSALRTPAPAYPLLALLGFCYHAVITSLNTMLQTRLSIEERGPVLGLWSMAFGGVMPIGLIVAGWIADWTTITVVLIYGGVTALLLVGLLWRVGDEPRVRHARAGVVERA